ncbi:MAG: class I SAM-dependent methyltransferase, partial [Chloroflexia bacterium]|nr:class I SAM-dependent methyltransferase [Chloroflexia bacterium]
RGGYLERKRELLGRLLIDVIEPRSILDVGCGSVEVVGEFSFSGKYTGIDLSPSILKRNRQLRPDWTFIEGDFLALAPGGGLDADLVICFDVLAYQHDEETYQRFVQELMNVTRRVAIINGFDSSHGRGKAPKLTAYHEPLSSTLSQLDAGQVSKVGRFRGTSVFRVDKLPVMSVE